MFNSENVLRAGMGKPRIQRILRVNLLNDSTAMDNTNESASMDNTNDSAAMDNTNDSATIGNTNDSATINGQYK